MTDATRAIEIAAVRHANYEMSDQLEAVCALCSAGPRDRQGHADLIPRLEALSRHVRGRVWLAFTCSRCASRWVRHRLTRGTYEWMPLR